MILSKADNVLREIEAMTKRKFLPIVGPHKGQVLVEVIRKLRPNRVLEVGTLIGYSTILMAKELESDAHLITIEIHSHEAEEARKNIKKAQVLPSIEVVVGDAVEVIPTLKGQFDLVFVDAEKSEYIDYLRLVENKLHKGSMIVADNAGIFADEMREFLSYVRSSGKYSSKYVPMGEDGLEVSVKLSTRNGKGISFRRIARSTADCSVNRVLRS